MSKNYQTEKLTEFKDIESDNTNRRNILQKLWMSNKSTNIDETTSKSAAARLLILIYLEKKSF
jgi:hypothetical protein